MGRKETEAAIQEARAGGLPRFFTVAELLADLKADGRERKDDIARAKELARLVDAGLEPTTPFDPAECLASESAIRVKPV